MKRFPVLPAVLLLAVALLLTGCGKDDKPSSSPTPATTTGSNLVAVDGDGFTVKWPAPATTSQQTFATPGGKVTATAYTTGDATAAFIAAMVPYPAGAAIDLDDVIRGVAKSFSGTIAVSDNVAVAGHDARQARIDGTSNGVPYTFYVLAVDVDGKLFQMQYDRQGTAPDAAPAILGEVASTVTFD